MRRFVSSCKRVLRVARKPDKTEYLEVVKITGLGIILIGLLGFIIMILGYLCGGVQPIL
jgi:protein transport protein SEC61 subunit gamma-like protein